eukprot:3744063-Pleurochrysis_carterae.AAC.1
MRVTICGSKCSRGRPRKRFQTHTGRLHSHNFAPFIARKLPCPYVLMPTRTRSSPPESAPALNCPSFSPSSLFPYAPMRAIVVDGRTDVS